MFPNVTPPQSPVEAGDCLQPEQIIDAQETVSMEFPQPCKLTLDSGHTVLYPAGVHEVPVQLADHFYLKAHGVKRIQQPLEAA